MARSGRRRSTTNERPATGNDRGVVPARDLQEAAAGHVVPVPTPPGPTEGASHAERGAVTAALLPHETTAAAIDPALARRAIVEHVRPRIDGGRFPAKRVVGDMVDVRADIFADGHDVIVAVLRDRPVATHGATEEPWRETRMAAAAPGADEWIASFTTTNVGYHEFEVVAWVDRFATWQRDLKIKAAAGQDIDLELLEGSLLVRDAAGRAGEVGSTRPDEWWFRAHADLLCDRSAAFTERLDTALSAPLAQMMFDYADRRQATVSATTRVWVDRERARTGAWYEMFPRSSGSDPARSATFREAAARLADIADLGFDVLYLPPIHPIGTSHRKGANNALEAGPADPGSPWAIGSEAGGHTAVEPGLGTMDDFEFFRAEAERVGLEIALDLAWQCSPDHPWVQEHPEWFTHRPDGSIKYAENPPKKYQDIYPLDFACAEWPSLWLALLDVTRFWIRRGVRIFRVDNPHTKSFGFWEWLIAEVRREDADVIFLAEAFTRPKLMRYLAKAGFSQSYTYFTWRNTKAELEEYLTELTRSEMREYFRPNFFANTPDILHEYLQHGGRAAFEARLVLAATLSPTYGIYSGYELCENRAVKPGSEEYLDSEKYQIRVRDWQQPGNIRELVRAVNRARRGHPALRAFETLRFCQTDNPELIAYLKTDRDGADPVLTVVNLDPHFMQHGHVEVPLDVAGLPPSEPYVVRDLLTDTPFTWRGAWNYVRLDPGLRQAHVLSLRQDR
ncbi:MAG: alpha-1,4-glucan--maltose-1-phosphate maltosyltransferase [Acidobacteria bacterium]|nr:alpha-1,4-glucan--maltose-1-phosphate maltosyltransferase [Acidobacteriota bacterium]